ncbi:MAG TPA: Kdo hydroxylase family protein [Gammaproteobacteria bacterium]|nr:Kdo hydroxylase family protein [Gammaproteobacteria bacterium]
MTVKQPQAVEITPDNLAALQPFELTDHLERGRVLVFPTAPLQLPSDEELHFLKHQTPAYHTRKNISYYPRAQRVMGIRAPAAIEQRTRAILATYQARVESCLQRLIPSFTPGWISATSSLRVFEENNRDIAIRSRSDRLHIDAGTYGASRGNLILRFLTNLDDKERVWRCKGTVSDLVESFGEEAGLKRGDSLLHDGLLNRIGSGMVRGLSQVFPVMGTLEQSAYDRAMRQMHNYMKESEAFHQESEGMVEIRFKPKSCWLVFADMAGHSCLSGEFAMINTFMVPRQNFRHPEFSPWETLRRYAAGQSALPPDIPLGT